LVEVNRRAREPEGVDLPEGFMMAVLEISHAGASLKRTKVGTN
jgi:hypothetical protein